MQIESITHQGLLRENNEDRFLVKSFETGALLAIADGMGGHAAGEVAAQLALQSLGQFSPESQDFLEELLLRLNGAHESIAASSLSQPDLRGMGTTLSAMFISNGAAHWLHVGDTRIYHFRGRVLTRITDDHTIPGTLLKSGEISKEQARLHPYGNVLLRCVGCDRHEPDTGRVEVDHGDLVMLSSDGLHDLIPDEQIDGILSSENSLSEKLATMVARCLEAGGKDNITAILAKI